MTSQKFDEYEGWHRTLQHYSLILTTNTEDKIRGFVDKYDDCGNGSYNYNEEFDRIETEGFNCFYFVTQLQMLVLF